MEGPQERPELFSDRLGYPKEVGDEAWAERVRSEKRQEDLKNQALRPQEMTVDEKLNEILVILREGQKLLTKYMNDMSNGGMMGMLSAFMGNKKG